ncbi:regulator of chromosome condensation 1/beta-lactamase-inhibitor protein II [Babesia gibsoni]|uniref:Regulator of chromosome condensation 1/beta-lactamase-inhibitor protein II n=1 Tax=Babesia gibsoni TaxID=33632 RepID=A0AAD8LPJ6_BABGI|nr:regulator of chromosome condensation 1/beta-lactamase-inhibitor protein II [Babesia gibsoni]
MEASTGPSKGGRQWAHLFSSSAGQNAPNTITVEAQSVISTLSINQVPNYKSLSTVIYIWGDDPVERNDPSMRKGKEPWTPTIYRNLSNVRISSVSCSSTYMMLLSSHHRLYALGRGEYGQLGLGSTVRFVGEPTIIDGLHTVSEVACGMFHCVALGNNGKVYSWGLSDLAGHKEGMTTFKPTEVSIKADPVKCRSIDVNDSLTVCACDSGHSLYHWGMTFTGFKIDRPQLLYSFDKERIRKVSVGKSFALALSEAGAVFCWGDSTYGETLAGCHKPNRSNCYLPRRISHRDIRNIVYIAAGGRHALLIDNSGRVISMGENMYGQCGTTPSHHCGPSLIEFPESPFVTTKVFCGMRHSACINNGGQLFTWGHSSNHKLIYTTSVESLIQPQNQPGVSKQTGKKSCCSQPQLIYSLLNEKIVCAGLAECYTVVVAGEGIVGAQEAEPYNES